MRYMSYPRTGPGDGVMVGQVRIGGAPPTARSLTRAKRDEAVKGKSCGDAVIKTQYELGDDLGVEGTPAIFTTNGDYVGGYMSAAQLVQTIQETEKAAAAAARRAESPLEQRELAPRPSHSLAVLGRGFFSVITGH